MKSYSEHKANDSGLTKSKKDKTSLKKRGVESPDLNKMYSMKVYINNISGEKFSHMAYGETIESLEQNKKNNYIYGEIIPPKKNNKGS